jgi:hypothetical protein
MKKLFIIFFTLFFNAGFSQSNQQQNKQDSISIVTLDIHLNGIIDTISIKGCSFKYKKFKIMRKHIYNDTLTNTATIIDVIKNDKVLRNLGLSSRALSRMKKLSKVIHFDNVKDKYELRRRFNMLADSKLYFAESIYSGIELLGMFNPDTNTTALKLNMGYMNHFNSIHYLWICMKSWVDLNSLNPMDQNYIMLKEKMEVISDRLNEVTKDKYYKFAITDISKEKVKDVGILSQNDFFVLIPFLDFNKDMGYTGGLHLSISTDLFKMRLLPYINGDHILSYQKFGVGFDVFTPYIRDTLQEFKAISYQHDRPFASTFYISRTKYRLHKKGHLRHTGEFGLMIIGGQFGRYFQELLHKDFTVSSIKPVGWDHQISNGGRLGFKIHQKFDFLLSSKDASIFKKGKCAGMRNLNPYFSLEGQLSHELTFLGSSINISSRDFFNASGNQTDYKLKKLQKTRLDYSFGAQLSYVIHNSLLGDFGIFNRLNDDNYDDEYLSTYYLTDDLIVKWIWKLSGQINYHYRNSTLFYSINLQRKEFHERPLSDIVNPEYKNILEERFNYKYYGWGTIGLVFNIN